MDEKWKNLLKMAQNKNPALKDPVLPYSETHVVGDFNGINNGNVNISWFKPSKQSGNKLSHCKK